MLKFAILLVLFIGIYATNGLSEQETIDSLFNDRYDRRVRPAYGGNKSAPVEVATNFYVRAITRLDDINNEMDVQLTFRQQWLDERLKYTHDPSFNSPFLTVINSPSNLMWFPDTFFSNEREGHYHNMLAPNQYVRVFPNGEVLHSTRLSLKLSCPMIFKNYPFDTQTCSIRMASYGYTTRDIIFKWKITDPVQVTSDLHLSAGFALTQFVTDYCDSQTNTGIYSCLRVDFKFVRDSSHYLTNFYIPCVMLVLVAFVSFWIDFRKITARLLFVALTLFTLCNHISEIKKQVPVTSYTKAIDVWTGICISFVFFTLLEFATCQFLDRQRKESKKNSAEDEERNDKDEAQKELKSNKSGSNILQIFVNKFESFPEQMDNAAKVVFPVAFSLFIISYWINYSRSESED